MKSKKWFDEKFLPSLYGKLGGPGELWLTVAQANVCLENMKVYTTTDGRGFMHTLAEYKWNGRDVRLIFSKKNGCGRILFGAEKLPVFLNDGKYLHTMPQIIRYVFSCKSKRELAIFTKWADQKTEELTREGTEVQDLFFVAYRKAVDFQTELLRGLDDGVLSCKILDEKYKRGLDRAKSGTTNKKYLNYLMHRLKEFSKKEVS